MFSTENRMNILIKTPEKFPEIISVRIYKGLIGKIMQIIGYAVLLHVDGIEIFANKRSLSKRILTNQGLSEKLITNRIKDKAIEILLTQPPFLEKKVEFPLNIPETVIAIAELEIHKRTKDQKFYEKKLKETQLGEVLSESDLDLIWAKKEIFTSKRVVYNYINGLIDIDTNTQSSCSMADPLRYIQEMLSIMEKTDLIQASLQKPTSEINIDKDNQSEIFTPLDNYLANFRARFEALPEEHQRYILDSAESNYTGISEEKQQELMKKEHDLKEVLAGELLSQFKKCMKFANDQNTARNGFIHFRLKNKTRATPFERIYIKMNKDRAKDLVHLLVLELYKEGKYPGILDIKIAGPQTAGRTDGIVIYIGETLSKQADEPLFRQKAIKQRDRILQKLKEIQKERPELFDNGPMPFKKIYSPAIAIIPGLSTRESFTDDLSIAITEALKVSRDREDFRKKIIESFFNRLS
jgi:hypothetical protein